MIDLDKMAKNVIDRVFGEQNLYKIDRCKYPDKLCKHYNKVYCKKCADELEKE
jgi:hypothetical protein